ncbi:MAG: helix-turn-helix domain-containing protein [Ignavibacteriae bacterium]|nr:helix-turn-helix domain-containing protein [Ignavibacteriota bacterium]
MANNKNDTLFLTFKQAVSYLDISESYLYKLTHQKQISYFKPGGKLIYFVKSDLDAWALSNKISSQNELADRALSYITNEKWRKK